MICLKEKLKVVIVEPGRYARITELEDTLEAKQKAVGGLITCAYPWEELVCIVANDEGLINGMPLNRAVEGFQVLAGPFFICGITEDDFCSLTDEQAERYRKMFERPELFLSFKDGYTRIPYDDTRQPDIPKEAAERISKRKGLPDLCFAPRYGGDDLALFQYGEMGFYPIPLQPGYKTGAECADALNERLGVSKAHRSAMMFGSLCGWDTPSADPARYGTDGKPIPPSHTKKEQEER